MSRTPKTFETTGETYTRLSQLGSGGAGHVFLVENTDGEQFALKLSDPASPSSAKPKRFRNEIEACRSIRHPGIVAILDDGFVIIDDQKVPFYVMPVYEGTLRNRIRNGIPLGSALPIFLQILNGINAAHLKGVFHRDLKPENILISSADSVVIADFGIASLTPEIAATLVETSKTERLANFVYAAPEQRSGGRDVDRRADIFSLGLILNEIFTGEVPQGSGVKTIASVHGQHAYLDPVVEKMTAQDPEARYSSIEDLKLDIAARGGVAVQRQRLDSLRGEVAPAAEADQLEAIKIINVDPEAGDLKFTFDRPPEPEFVSIMNTGQFSWAGVAGAEPRNLVFNRDTARITLAQPHLAQQIIDRVKEWLGIVLRLANQERTDKARRRDAEALEKRRRLIEEQKTMLEIKKDLRW